MKTQIHFKPVALALVLAVLAMNVPAALAFPPLPSSFWGKVKMNGANVSPGTVVSAWINGVRYAQATVSVYNGDTVYSVDVPGDDPSTPGLEGGVPGNTVVFYIGNWEAYQTALWQSGTNVGRDLSVDVLTANYNLSAGWNLLALPVETGTAITAESALSEIAARGGSAVEVDRWLAGGWDSHVYRVPLNDFVLELGKGYFFLATGPGSTWTRTGRLPPNPLPVTLNVGWNLVGFPRLPRPMTAEAVLNGISAAGGNCVEMDRWYSGGWTSHVRGVPLDDFDINNQEGYFVLCSRSSIYTPN